MSDAAGDAAGDAWQAIIGALCTAGAALAGDAGLADVDVAEGLRYVLTVLGDQVEPAALRGSDHAIFPPRDHARQQAVLRQPRADYYDTALVSGDRTYRITGQRGTAPY